MLFLQEICSKRARDSLISAGLAPAGSKIYSKKRTAHGAPAIAPEPVAPIALYTRNVADFASSPG
ncbi:MAG: hypothetical protein AB7H71_09730 [Alphaproteobacteria bacterium]